MTSVLANYATEADRNYHRLMSTSLVISKLPQNLSFIDFGKNLKVRDTSPPFRVLEKCQDLCHRDRMPTNNLVRTCTSFDFQPGNRIAAFNGATEYEESTCYLTQEQGDLDGISNLFFVPNSVHFIEVCLSCKIENECPNRRYVFERHPRKALKVPDQDMKLTDMKEVSALNRSDCEDRCLNEFTFVCRSISYNAGARTCLLSRFTRRSHPERFVDDPTSDYLENTCLSAERRCDGIAVFVKEENKRLGGPFEMDIYSNFTLEECQIKCLQAEKYFCRSIEYDVQSRQCSILEEDTVSQKDDLRTSSSPTHHIYELVCLEDREFVDASIPSQHAPRTFEQQGGKIPDNSVTSHLFSDGRRPDTAFQRYRNNRLGGEYHSEITGRTLSECLDECLRQASFQCRSAVYSERFRICRLSRFNQRDGLRIIYDADYDYYENLMSKWVYGFAFVVNSFGVSFPCLHFLFARENALKLETLRAVPSISVSQSCNEDGMEFTLRTPEGFYGRVYTYGFYDRCFFRGNGGTANVLRISGAQGYPECGTQRYTDTMTNIVVVQFSDYVQTGRDKRYNLTCLFRGPGEAVVTSGYIGAGSGSPIPIEYLPAENSLSSRVRLLILYQGRPTTTIAVGDPLTFRLEAQDGYNYVTDIFATNVIARDPYSGRSVQLIDRYGCPVDNYVFPGLDRSRSGDGLEARFSAFKIPESNFLVFEATVRTCRDGCQPAYCTGHAGRNEPSFGRRKREISESNDTTEVNEVEESQEKSNSTEEEEQEQVREMIQVYESRHDLDDEVPEAVLLEQTVCLTTAVYNGLVAAIVIILGVLLAIATVAGICYRRYWSTQLKNTIADSTSPSNCEPYPPNRNNNNFSFLVPGVQKVFETRRSRQAPSITDVESSNTIPSISNGRVFDDPSEPIYTDPSLFERSRSLRSIAVSQAGLHRQKAHLKRFINTTISITNVMLEVKLE
uniref:Uncharacterized protein n=1 Tax=Timema genevievae TaxID=629358 RepID=A0A7R9K3K4_TIMGE|nr:unnamed protein product [Timema genevievae]